MKKGSALFVLVLMLAGALSAQNSPWQWANPLPQGNILNGIWAVNTDTLIAVGDVGTIIRSTDGGSTWQVNQNAAGLTNQLFATQFISPSLGWAVGESGTILKTTDGGLTWFSLTIETYSDLYALHFISPTVGWVTGTQGVIYQTIDGGNSWTAENSNTAAILFYIHFTSPTVGWAMGTEGILLKTTNGGGTWNPVSSGTSQTLYALQFVTPTTAFISGSFGTMLKTTDGGTTWISLFTGSESSLYAMQFISSQTGWAAGSSGGVIKTTNGGTTWTSLATPTQNDLFGVAFTPAGAGWIVGDVGTILKSFDGTSWISISTGPNNAIYDVKFSSPNVGFAVGDAGTILNSTDGGLTWSPQNSNTYQPLYGAYFLNASTGWVVGDSGNVLRTTNSGVNWYGEPTGTDLTLYDICFTSSTAGIAVGDFGTVLLTGNGGITWSPTTTPTQASLVRVRFANANVGWAIGYNGTILKTLNGGVTWTTQVSGTGYILNAIAVIDQQTAVIGGDLGLILTTTDGGTTWTQRNSNTTGSIYGVAFYSSLIGYADADDGSIVSTFDGGQTWQDQNSITSNSFFDLQIVRSASGGIIFASGDGGTILTSTISPLPIRVWTGSFDSLWSNPSNWNPAGVPQPIDSVYIPATAMSPSIRSIEQQIEIGALSIAPGAKLTVSATLATFVVQNSISTFGSLYLEPAARTTIYVGGSLLTQFNGTFSPGLSTVVFMGSGQIKGTFYNVFVNSTASMQSIGNIQINNYLNVAANVYLRSSDTLAITGTDPNAIEGTGIISPGTIRRSIQPGSTQPYRFESPVTYIDFYPQGTDPTSVDMTLFPNALPAGVPDSLFVRRYFMIHPNGGSNFMAYMSLRYDSSETALTVDNLSLFIDSSGVLTNEGSTDFLDSDLVAVSLDSVTQFSEWLIGRADYFPHNPYAFAETLFTADHSGRLDTLVFGAAGGATDGIDSTLGEIPLGPKPSVGTYDLRWLVPPSNGTKIDYRNLLSTTYTQQTYTFSFQPGPASSPLTLHWDSTALPTGTCFLQDQQTHGALFSINMKSQQTFSLTAASPVAAEIVHKLPLFYPVASGWNLLSLPLRPTNDGRRITTFPTAVSEGFGYNGAYYVVDTLRKGTGYWIKFATAQLVGFEGVPRTIDTIPVIDGWNLIGGGSKPIPVAAIATLGGTSVKSNYFGYANGYQFTDTLEPSQGYWVKMAGAGSIILNSTSIPAVKSANSPAAALKKLNTITVTDNAHGSQVLYLGDGSAGAPDPGRFELPPAPPAGNFDARFGTGTMLDLVRSGRTSREIRFQSASYPVSLRWNIAQSGIHLVTFSDAKTGKILRQTGQKEGSLRITDPLSTRIVMTVDYAPDLPTQFSLSQNYPNPFNPTTEIDVALPVDAQISLVVYNILGQSVQAVLSGQFLTAGVHTFQIDGRNLSSGVYFCRLQASGKNGISAMRVRKMLLVR